MAKKIKEALNNPYIIEKSDDKRPMDLIIKPTDICNFACTFCSSPSLAPSKADKLELDKIFQFLRRYPNTNTIIVNGGDPTMMPPKYYWILINFLEMNDLPANISITSNLWDFYLKPNKWKYLFRHPRFQVTTSFNYGDGRRITKNRVFTEDDFIKVSDLFLKEVGYRPHFISVIEEENMHTAIDNVRLAKFLDVDCKLNYLNASGHAGKPLPLSKIYEIYVQIWREGLAPWEWNTRQMANRLVKMPTTCPLNRRCDEGIRVLHPDGRYFSCGAFADDLESEIDFEKEMSGGFVTPLQTRQDVQYLKDECLSCPMFDICNGCYKHVKDLKQSNMIEPHCAKMKSIAKDILGINFETPIENRISIWNETYLKDRDLVTEERIEKSHTDD